MCYKQRSSAIPEAKKIIFTNPFSVLTKNSFQDYEVKV